LILISDHSSSFAVGIGVFCYFTFNSLEKTPSPKIQQIALENLDLYGIFISSSALGQGCSCLQCKTAVQKRSAKLQCKTAVHKMIIAVRAHSGLLAQLAEHP